MLSLLVLAVVGVQVWLHNRQMQAVERSLGTMATSIGKDLLMREMEIIDRLGIVREEVVAETGEHSTTAFVTHDVMVEVVGEEETKPIKGFGKVMRWNGTHADEGQKVDGEEFKVVMKTGEIEEGHDGLILGPEGPGSIDTEFLKRVIHLEVSDERPRMMMVFEGGDVTEIEIPTSPTMDIFHSTLQSSLMAAGLLLVVGLAASAVVSRRLARPLQDLARRAEELGSGGVGLRVPVTTTGEVGELEAAFDRMSVRLGQLETEREEWRRREHLAQLGDLSRGLAHTVRNPLHTLGLAVEELAGEGEDSRVTTARTEIRRIDRWIRSFLALGAGDAASAQRCDLVELVQESLLEAAREGIDLRLQAPETSLIVEVVPTGLRAALGNLVENAVQASDEGGTVDVVISSEGGQALIKIRDWGPGLPDAVRERLYEPHQTTRPGGAGMGLFLARQLIEEMHGGTLALEDADGGGTLVTIDIPTAEV